MQSKSRSGWCTSKFLFDVDPDLICAICLDVKKHAIKLQICHHSFCLDCISVLISASGGDCVRCPLDRLVSPCNTAPCILTRDMVNALQAKCRFFQLGCAFTGTLIDVCHHELNCSADPRLQLLSAVPSCVEPIRIRLFMDVGDSPAPVSSGASQLLELFIENPVSTVSELRRELAAAFNECLTPSDFVVFESFRQRFCRIMHDDCELKPLRDNISVQIIPQCLSISQLVPLMHCVNKNVFCSHPVLLGFSQSQNIALIQLEAILSAFEHHHCRVTVAAQNGIGCGLCFNVTCNGCDLRPWLRSSKFRLAILSRLSLRVNWLSHFAWTQWTVCGSYLPVGLTVAETMSVVLRSDQSQA